MEQKTIYLVLCGTVLLLLGALYYFVRRKCSRFETTQTTLMNHLMNQQRVLERHDQFISQVLGTPLSPELTVPSSTPLSRPSAVEACPGGVCPLPVNPSPSPSSESTIPIAPMMNSILNMFTSLGPMGGGIGGAAPPSLNEEEEDDDVSVLNEAMVENELKNELQELKKSAGPLVDLPEGRIDEAVAVKPRTGTMAPSVTTVKPKSTDNQETSVAKRDVVSYQESDQEANAVTGN